MKTKAIRACKLFAVLLAICVGLARPAFGQPAPPSDPFLGVYYFEDTNWLSLNGNAPIGVSNLISIPLWGTNALLLDTGDEVPAFLNYHVIETNGNTNIAFDEGAVRCVFICDWATADTNQNGSGPGNWSYLIGAGDFSSGSPDGLWRIYIDPGGTNLYFGGVSNSTETVYASAPISWASNSIHLLGITYTGTNSTMYLDGQLAATGSPVTIIPDTNTLTNGFFVGSDSSGYEQAQGVVYSLDFYNSNFFDPDWADMFAPGYFTNAWSHLTNEYYPWLASEGGGAYFSTILASNRSIYTNGASTNEAYEILFGGDSDTDGSFFGDDSPETATIDFEGYDSPAAFQVSPRAFHWGDTNMAVQFSIANIGNTAYSGTFNVGFYLSRDTTISNSDDYLLGKLPWNTSVMCSSTGGVMLSDYAYSSDVLIRLPSVSPFTGTPPPTNFYVAMWVNCDNQVAESNESNDKNQGAGYDRDTNTVSIIPPVPHILATSSSAPFTNLTVNFTNVVNDGPGNAVGVQTVTVINTGGAFLTVSNVGLAGSTNFTLTSIADSAQSRFIAPASLALTPQQIQPFGQEAWVFTLRFDPTSNGVATGTLFITNNDPTTNVLSISLSGTGVAVPQLALTTPSSLINFGGQVDDGAGGFQTTLDILIQNNGSGLLTVSQNGISLLTGTQFSILSITSSANGTINLATGSNTIAQFGSETWDIKVRFDPTNLGVLNDGLKILSNDTNNPTFILPLQGQGLNPAQLVVSDASGVISNRTEVFPGVDADGPGLQQAATNITLQNYGDVPIIIPSNGLSFNSTTQFLVSSIVSSTAGVINLSTNSAQIAPDTNETWTVTLLFDPSVAGTLTNMLSIYASNLLTQTTNVITNVAVSGTGLTRASLVVSNSTSATNNLAVSFGNVMNYSIGGPPSFATLTLINRGNQPLIIGQNGLTFSGNPGFSITNIVSSTSRVIDLTSTNTSMRTISTNETEIWTVTLMFKALSDGIRTNVLSIASNDPQNPITQVALSGVGVMPNITLDTPASQLDVSAGSTFTFAWQTTYPLTSATIALYLDTNSNAGSGLIPIASGIQNNGTNNSYTWQVSPTLVGTNYYVYATMTDGDGDVPGTSFAAGRLKIDPVGTFQLLSSVQSTNANYVYNYAFNGVTYTGTNELALGVNVIYVTNSTAIYQFIVTRVPELAQVDAVQYNQLNQVTTTTNGNGIVTTLTYDQMGRLVRRQSSNGAVVTYAYDVLGNRTSMTDYTGTTFYQYDDLNRLTGITYSKDNILGNGDDLTLSYEYDLAGRETAIVYPGGERIQYTYDNAGRISTVSNVTRSLSFQYTYNSGNGLLTKLTRPNGIETDCGYDGMGRLTNILHQVTSTSALVAQFGYSLDAIGKATLLTTTLPGGVVKLEQYNYDYFDRLTNVIYGDSGVINSTALSVSYSYDGNGNRLTMTTKTNNAVTEIRYYTYGNENRLLSVTNQSGTMIATYGYDPAGNRIQKISTNNTAFYTYDERNLMTGYADATNQIAYTYNGDAQRVNQTVNDTATNYIVDPNRNLFEVVQERNGSGTVTASYTFGATRLATWNGSAVTFELGDRLGSVRLVTDSTGNLVTNYNYDVFGAFR